MTRQQAIDRGIWRPLGDSGVGITREGTICTWAGARRMIRWVDGLNNQIKEYVNDHPNDFR